MLNADQRFRDSLARAHATACDALLAERDSEGFWVGELSSSALATATAVSALSLVRDSVQNSGDFKSQISNLIENGLRWLAENQNADGGWGDTTLSLSNISTTMLVRAAFHLAGAAECHAAIVERATAYIDRAGGTAAVVARYGEDRTFAVPILANCALAGQVNWQDVTPLPFELACLPRSLFQFLRLHVVSYALPALIAIGQLIHAKRPSRNVFTRWLRNLTVGATLRKLETIQPKSGGFLEAVPLTSFVIMSLAALDRGEHPVSRKGVEFLANSVRADGSWPIDSNLSVWLTTLAVNALAADGECKTLSRGIPARGPVTNGIEARPSGSSRAPLAAGLSRPDGFVVRDWLLLDSTHRCTGAWGWTHLPGSVPDADDTAGALLALSVLSRAYWCYPPVAVGLKWLLELQNRDGGWPTFCRGWTKLPFDRSGADLTAHVLRTFAAWGSDPDRNAIDSLSLIMRMPSTAQLLNKLQPATLRALEYLRKAQRPDGSWVPLWFGNQHAPDDENPTYGTAKVLAAYRDLNLLDSPEAARGIAWLTAAQNPDGGWSGASGVPSTVEETALAVEALSGIETDQKALESMGRGVQWLIDRVESGDWRKPSPIGLYFAKLWYFETLYPIIFTVAALGRARRALNC